MFQKRLNILILIIIILCSTSFYNLSFLGVFQKAFMVLGIGLIVLFLVIHLVYAKSVSVKKRFSWMIYLILFSFFTSMFMAYYTRGQTLMQSAIAQIAILYYLMYFLLHHLKIPLKTIEKIIVIYGVVHFVLYLVQFFMFPTIIFDAYILKDRGTVRIYLAGGDYLMLCFFMAAMAYFKTNRIKYLIMVLLAYSIFVLLGGRQTMIILAFVFILFLLTSKKVRSRLVISALVALCVFLVLYLFKDIFNALHTQSIRNLAEGGQYVRLRAMRFFLTDFFISPLAYVFGNGAPNGDSSYGNEIMSYIRSQGYYLGDIGLIGNYAMYGMFFLVGVLGICIKAIRIKIQDDIKYIRYAFIAISISLITGGGFANPDFICFTMIVLYMLDISHYHKFAGDSPAHVT